MLQESYPYFRANTPVSTSQYLALHDRYNGIGGVIIGDVPSWRADHTPYRGVKDSGPGREGVRYAIEDTTELRLLVIRDPY